MGAVQPIVVSYSELDTFRQCPLKHHLLYRQRWTKEKALDSAVGKGSLWHSVMEMHYGLIKAAQTERPLGKIAPSEEQTLLKKIAVKVHEMLWDPKLGQFITDIHDLIWWMYEGHVAQYGADLRWKILGIEHQIITPLRDARGRRSRYHLKAKIDLLVQDRGNGSIWVVDHKSGANLPTKMDLEIDDQFGLYTWAMREVGRKVQGSIHNANRTQRNKSFMPLDTRMSQTYLNRNEVEITNLALDAYYAARAAHPPKDGQRALYSSPDPRSCGWKCDVKEPHLVMRRGRKPEQVMTEFGFRIDRTRH